MISLDLTNNRASDSGKVILNKLLSIKFNGLGGEFHLVNRKPIAKPWEIVNVIRKGERRVGFWTEYNGIATSLKSKPSRSYFMKGSGLEDIIWPRGSTTTPKGLTLRMSNVKKHRCSSNVGIRRIHTCRAQSSNQCHKCHRALCRCVHAALQALPYVVPYEFVPFNVPKGRATSAIYNDLIYQVYLQNYDVVVGDTTINANKSLYVDLTIPFTELGVGVLLL